jgi:hypothetical protein
VDFVPPRTKTFSVISFAAAAAPFAVVNLLKIVFGDPINGIAFHFPA